MAMIPLGQAMLKIRQALGLRVKFSDLDNNTVSSGKPVSVMKVPGKLSACGYTYDGSVDVTLPAVPVKPDPSKPGEYFTLIFPVGFICFSSVNTNPAVYLGYGTWTSFGQGRVLVGVDTGDADFNTPKKPGGAKTVSLTWDQNGEHNHIAADHISGTGTRPTRSGGYAGSGSWNRAPSDPSQGGAGTVTNVGWSMSGGTANETSPLCVAMTGKGAPHNNLQPYITVYMWERTA